MKVAINLVGGSFAIVEAETVKKAEIWARWEFGNSNVRSAKEATQDEVAWYQSWNGIIHQSHDIESV